MATSATQIAALEAERNEAQVRAEGALMGERRAAIARLAMIAMFGTITQLGDTDPAPGIMVVGISYTVFGLLLLFGLFVRAKANVRFARWLPLLSTVSDYFFLTLLAMLKTLHSGFNPGQHAVSTMLVMSFAVARFSIWHVVFALACAEISWVILTTYAGVATAYPTLFAEGALLVMGFLLAVTNRALGAMFHGLRQRDNLTRFLPRQVADRVIAVGPSALAPVEREITVLFSDIRGFTGLSEGLEPREVLAMLDDYFGRMGLIVKGHDGVIGKFIGDGLLAFWGVPDRLEDHATRAVRAARDMRRELVEINRDREKRGQPPIKIGIGIHTGTVAAGMLGGALQSEYTVIGDAVNVASRIEGLTKEHATDLLISETTWAHLKDPGGERLASVPIRGRKEPVVLYTINTINDPGAAP